MPSLSFAPIFRFGHPEEVVLVVKKSGLTAVAVNGDGESKEAKFKFSKALCRLKSQRKKPLECFLIWRRTMTRFLSTFACAAGAIGWVHADAATSSDATRSPERQQPLRSILMITVDDLRVELNASYGMDMVSTPNIDRLAHEGTTFLRAMTQMAVCSPSRNSFMSGR